MSHHYQPVDNSGSGYPPPPNGGGDYPPQPQGGFPPQQQQPHGGFPPQQQGGHPPQPQGGYPPQQPPSQQGGFPPQQQGGHPPQQNTTAPPNNGEQQERVDREYVPPSEPPQLTTAGFITPTANLVPAAPEEQAPQQQKQEMYLDDKPFQEADARLVIDQWASNTWLRKRGIGQQFPIERIVPSNTYVVFLETYLETRSLDTAYRRYHHHEAIDGPFNGPAPAAWDIIAPPPAWFRDHVKTLPLPHTEEVRRCFQCHGCGETRCIHCHGHGHVKCHHCHGHGHISKTKTLDDGSHEHYKEHCHHCHHGETRCSCCHGRGWITCSTCSGNGQLVHFIELTIKWKNNQRRVVVEALDDGEGVDEKTKLLLPKGAIDNAQGPILHAEEGTVLAPGTGETNLFRVNEQVNNAVNIAINESHNRNALQHRQRVNVRGVPTYKVCYTWKKESKVYWVLGTNRKVVAPNYPVSMLRVIALVLVILLVLALLGAAAFAVYWFVIKD